LDWFQGVLCKRSAVLQPLVVLLLIQTYLNKQWVCGSLNVTCPMCNDRGDEPTVRSNSAFSNLRNNRRCRNNIWTLILVFHWLRLS
jgi:hypothetical protein